MHRAWYLVPLGLTLASVIWTAIVAPFTKYGVGDWAVIPPLVLFVSTVAWYGWTLINGRESRLLVLGVGSMHLLLFFFITLWCLTFITKDSL
jgi:hypothetical protein